MTGPLPPLRPIDHAVLAVVIIATIVELRWVYPAFLRAGAAGVPGIRLRAYAVNLLTSWGLTVVVLALWRAEDRPWSALSLGMPDAVRGGVVLALTALYVLVVWAQVRALLARPEGMERLRAQLGTLPPILPRTTIERRVFALVAITAGFCEEVLARGYLLWYFATLTTLPVAVLLSSALFGAAHLYLGRQHAVRAFAIGLVMAAIVIATHSLWPAIVLHAVIDGVSGELAFRARPAPGAA
jgi:uncharacterized protein